MSSAYESDVMLSLEIFANKEVAVSENAEHGVDSVIYKGSGYNIVS
tara:strand:- start:333 stop:470 length:138 start_codon:yes stop_codon:yes gene_type:complete